MLMTGIGSGIDYESMIAAIVGAERAPKDNQLARQEGMNHAEKNALQEIQFTLNSFRDKVEDLNSNRELQKLKALLSREDVLSASVDSNAVPGEYSFEVKHLAQAQRDQLFKAPEDSTFLTGTISFGAVSVKIDGAGGLQEKLTTEQTDKKAAHVDQVYQKISDDKNLNLDLTKQADRDIAKDILENSANSDFDPDRLASYTEQQKTYDDKITRLNTQGVTIEELQLAINNDAKNDGVKATLVRSGTDVSMVLNAKETGKDNGYSITSSLKASDSSYPDPVPADPANPPKFTSYDPAVHLQDPLDATVMFGTMELTSASNKMENVIDGITLNLKAANKTGETVNVKVERDEASVNSTIKSFVEDYNKIIETVNTYTKSSEDKAAALSGNSATRSMVSRLRGVIGAEYGSSNYNTLSRLGITTNREGGTLKIDQKKLDKALEDDFDAVSKLFLGDESNSQIGMMDQMMLVLDDYHKNGGTYDRRIDQLEINNKQIAEDREKLDSRMEAKTLSLRSYYARMDTQIAQMNQTQNMLVSMLM